MKTTKIKAALVAAMIGLTVGTVMADTRNGDSKVTLNEVSKAASQTSVAGRLIYFGLPRQADVDETIDRLRPYANRIRVGVGEAGPIYGFNASARQSLFAAFADAGFTICSGWGVLSEVAGEDDALRDAHMRLLESARKLAQVNAIIVDKAPFTQAGSTFFHDEIVESGAGTGMDRLFVDIGTANGVELRDDAAFATMAALMSEQIRGGAEWDCMNG